ncbi:hypothetical protein CTA2_2188 [Colletotrichum tanaceti]|uniref:Uncharacterized protein n=1 Tax=Colletotrichum tanaceti TaxID=1306861 RepID=A0A4U6XHS6_9PEZI|nr:hypothetical protein CTA2_2196 [Colletotrichum tanaceti]KAJ0167509.1 hypothetical protein CTA2_2188 [Colletotrichum tanaceti]TKW55301.1 hypothetical protein CTA1_955 [Colletotrichum tanaceti]
MCLSVRANLPPNPHHASRLSLSTPHGAFHILVSHLLFHLISLVTSAARRKHPANTMANGGEANDEDDPNFMLPRREPASPLTTEDQETPDRLSFVFRTRTIGELLSVSCYNKVRWRPSDNILIRSFLAFYRLGASEIKNLKGTPSTKKIRRRFDAAGPKQRPIPKKDPGSPDLHQLAAWMNIDLASLSDAEWAAIRAKMISTLDYTIKSIIKEHGLTTYWDADVGGCRLRWPDKLRQTWLHPQWKGDMDSCVPASQSDPPAQTVPPRARAPAETRGQNPGNDDDDDDNAGHDGRPAGSGLLSTPPLSPLSPLSTWRRQQVGLDQPPPRRGNPTRNQARPARPGIFPITPPHRRQNDLDEDCGGDDGNGDGDGWGRVNFGSSSRPALRPRDCSALLPANLLLRQAHGPLPPPPPPPPPPLPQRQQLPVAVSAGLRSSSAQPIAGVLIDAILRYNTATQELVNVSINEMAARLNLHKALFQTAPEARGPPRRVLTPQQRADCTRALIASLVADADDGKAASRLPLPAEGDFGPLRRLVKLQARRRELMTLMQELARSVRLMADGVGARAWYRYLMVGWEPEMPWIGVM